jgi:hypothetical protein
MAKTAVELLLEKITLKKVDNDIYFYPTISIEDVEKIKEMHKQEIEQHAINFNLFVENDEVTDQKVEIVENLYKDYLKEFYNETFGGKDEQQ